MGCFHVANRLDGLFFAAGTTWVPQRAPSIAKGHRSSSQTDSLRGTKARLRRMDPVMQSMFDFETA